MQACTVQFHGQLYDWAERICVSICALCCVTRCVLSCVWFLQVAVCPFVLKCEHICTVVPVVYVCVCVLCNILERSVVKRGALGMT